MPDLNDLLSPAAARDKLSTEMARRWDAVNTVLADLDDTERRCRDQHYSDCLCGTLAARIRRTLTGEDADRG